MPFSRTAWAMRSLGAQWRAEQDGLRETMQSLLSLQIRCQGVFVNTLKKIYFLPSRWGFAINRVIRYMLIVFYSGLLYLTAGALWKKGHNFTPRLWLIEDPGTALQNHMFLTQISLLHPEEGRRSLKTISLFSPCLDSSSFVSVGQLWSWAVVPVLAYIQE